MRLNASRALQVRSVGDLRAANIVYRTLQIRWLAWIGKRLARLGLKLRIPGVAWLLRRTRPVSRTRATQSPRRTRCRRWASTSA
jgi:hypothetical protein